MPVIPPPTMTTSAVMSAASAGNLRSSVALQYEATLMCSPAFGEAQKVFARLLNES
jgi:hypothetical protein